jgi:hypothetical protein
VHANWGGYWLRQYTDGEHGPNPKFVPAIRGNSKGRLDCDHFAGTDQELRDQCV